MKYIVNKNVLTLSLLLIASLAMAQPANDECSSTEQIIITNSGYDFGTFTSSWVKMDSATVNLSEPFHSDQTNIGNNKKSIWFSFSIASKRTVSLTLSQQGTSIPTNDIGFTIYKSTTCHPSIASVSTEINPRTSLGSSSSTCLSAGDYLVQVSSKTNTQGNVRLSIASSASAGGDIDKSGTSYFFGTVSQGIKSYVFNTTCLSIENANEIVCSSSNLTNYAKSAWVTFSTDDYQDYLAFTVRQNSGSLPATATGQVYAQLFEGDVSSVGTSGLTAVDSCNTLTVASTSRLRRYICSNLKANTNYTLKLLLHNDLAVNLKISLTQYGYQRTTSPTPIIGSIGTNNLGVLPHLATGSSYTDTSYLGCNAFLSNNSCGTVNPSLGYIYGTDTFDLSDWMTFEIANLSSLKLSSNSSKYKFKLYNQGVNANCNTLSSSDIIAEYTASTALYCLPAGKYSIQILGRSDTNHIALSQLGRRVLLTFETKDLTAVNAFSLNTSTAVDNINSFSPLPYNTAINASSDSFGCNETVLPNTSNCNVNKSKAAYRIFKIGDSDGDSAPDSGYVTISNLNITDGLEYELFLGNAKTEAISQSAFSATDTIFNLTSKTNCITTSKTSLCLNAADYTLVTYGDSADVSKKDRPAFLLQNIQQNFSSRGNADNLGNISSLADNATKTSVLSTYGCSDNAKTIGGIAPCSGSTKAIYREFYLSKPTAISIRNISGAGFHNSYNNLFKGRATSSTVVLDLYHSSTTGNWSCFTSKAATSCEPLPIGWYTIVTFAKGSSFNQTVSSGNATGLNHQLEIKKLPEYIKPSYNRPYKACMANGGSIISLTSSGGLYPSFSKQVTLCKESFDCQPDTPFSALPLVSCSPTVFNRVAYYVFETSDTTLLNITGVSSGSLLAQLYSLDVTTDSTLLVSAKPLQNCQRGSTNIEICDLLPGKYTLVIQASNGAIGGSVTPVLRFDKANHSQFDFAANAYDFDTIPKSNTWVFGKPGDTNPINSSWKPSTDYITCLSGADTSNPKSIACLPQPHDSTYLKNANIVTFNTLKAGNNYVRRNLWYTFRLEGTGKCWVNVKNVTAGKTSSAYRPIFSIYESDADGSLNFTAIKSGALQDSTSLSGLTLVGTNASSSCGVTAETISIIKDECNNITSKRYYIIVEKPYNTSDWSSDIVEVSASYKSVEKEPASFDHFANANRINGLSQTNKPYTTIQLDTGKFSGATSSIVCATKSNSDQNTCGDNTVWYRFDVDENYSAQLAYSIDSIGKNFNANNIELYKQTIANDSTSTGLLKIGLAPISKGSEKWGEACISQGSYFIMISGCDYDIESLTPYLTIIKNYGDFCAEAVTIQIAGAETKAATTSVSCHTIGNDFAEDGSNMGCLKGPEGYKSTWFKIEVTGSGKYDLSAILSESSNVTSSDISLRFFYGDCSAQTADKCIPNGSKKLSLNCIEAGNYMIQVISPAATIGTVSLTVSTSISNDPNCVPRSDNAPLANFTYTYNCTDNDVIFQNLSSRGDSISYLWDYNNGSQSSDSIYPQFTVSRSSVAQIIPIKLKVTNNTTHQSDSSITSIFIFPRLNHILGNDTFICEGDSMNLDALYIGYSNSYLWDDNNTNSSKYVKTTGSYWVTITTDSCVATDTIIVNVGKYPTANFSTSPICLNILDSLNNTSAANSSDSLSFSWDLDDGFTSSDSTPLFTYSSLGKKDIRLIVTSTKNCSDTITKQIEVHSIPSVDFSFTDDCALVDIPFTNLSIDGNPMTYKWQYGDASISTAKNPTHEYKKEGTYTIKLIAENDKTCTDSISKTIKIFEIPRAKINTNNTAQCLESNNFITADNSSLSTSTFAANYWKYSDGSTLTGINVSKTFSAEGSKDITLYVESIEGCKDTIIQKIDVWPTPKASFTINNKEQCISQQSFDFTGTSTLSTGSLSSFDWTMGDGNSKNLENILDYEYTSFGIKLVTLKVTTDKGCVHSKTETIEVTSLPNAKFVGLNLEYCLNTPTITLKPFLPGGQFSGPGISGNTYTPIKLGKDSVMHRITINGCTDSFTRGVFVKDPPHVKLGNDTTICLNSFIVLKSKSVSANYKWNTGQRDSSIVVVKPGYYSLTASNLCGTVTDDIYVSLRNEDCDIYIPSSFTPNNDGINDAFHIWTKSSIVVTDFILFNRWGEIVYQKSKNEPISWDGSYKNKIAAQGNYVYHIKYHNILPTGRLIKVNAKGVVSVLK